MNKEIKIITEEHCHIPLNVYAAQIHLLKPNPQCDVMWRWTLRGA